VCALGLFPASIPPHRSGAGLRLDMAVAAADRQGRASELSLMGEKLAAEMALQWD